MDSTLRWGLALPLLALLACAGAPPPGPETPLAAGLARYGSVDGAAGGGRPLVVVVRDRHVLHGAITRIRGAQRRLQTETRDALAFLLEKEFRFLGCESTQGPLPDGDGPERFHRRAVREALAERDDLSAWTVYQPIRFEMEFRGRLTVEGVEDPELYAEDVARLEDILELRRLLRDASARPEELVAVRERERRLRREIARNVDRRGRRAAENLLEALARRGEDRGILMIGGAHAPGAIAGLEDAGAAWIAFTPASYGSAEP